MNCLKCNETTGLDRVVVDTLTGAEAGGLCDACLEACRSPVFRDEILRREADCAVCAETPHYELPRIDCRIQHTDDRPDEIEYTISDATLRLCREHLQAVLTEASSDAKPTEAIASQ